MIPKDILRSIFLQLFIGHEIRGGIVVLGALEGIDVKRGDWSGRRLGLSRGEKGLVEMFETLYRVF